MPLPWTELALEGWLLLALAGGVAAMDESAWPQAMVCRPLVAATVGGAMAGTAGDGLLVGLALEVLWIPYPPFGAARRPEAGPASVIAGSAFAGAGAGDPVGLLVAVLGGWVLGWLGSVTLGWQWRWNARLVAGGPGPADPELLESRHRWGPPLAFLRGFGFTGALLVPAVAVVGSVTRWLEPAGGLTGTPAAASWALAAALGLAAGAGIRSLDRSWWGFLLGGIAGAAVVVVAGAP